MSKILLKSKNANPVGHSAASDRRRKTPVVLFLTLAFFISPAPFLSGQEPFTMTPDTCAATIGKHCSCLVDTGRALVIGEVSEIEFDPAFIPSAEEILNFGYTTAAVWLRFTVENRDPDRHWFLKLDAFDDVRVYLPQTGAGFREYVLGRRILSPAAAKRGGYFYLDLPPTVSGQAIYVRYVHEDTMVLHPSVVDFQSILMTSSEDFITTLYIGIIGVMVLYNLLLFLFLRDSSYVYYALYILNMLLLQMELSGMFLNVLVPGGFITTDMVETVVIALALGFYAQFVRKFLLSAQMNPRADRMLRVLFFVAIAHIPTIFFVPFLARTISLTLLLLAGLTMIGVLVVSCLRRRYTPVRFYMMALAFLAMGMIVFLLRNFNILPNNILTEFSMQIGTSVEAVLLAFGLAFRINILQRERELAFATSRESQRRAQKVESDYQMLFETAPLGIALFDLEGKYLAVNHSYCEMYEQKAQTLKGVSFIESVYQTERRKAEKAFWDTILKRAAPGIISFERTNQTASGKRIIVRYFLNFTKNEKGEPSGLLCCVEDITDLKRALDELKNSLAEKDLLLKELHHRVKNNLQIIISLFRMKTRLVNDPRVEAVLESTAGRIRAIANLHNRIYLAHNVAHVDSATFVESTIKQTLAAFHIGDNRLKLSLAVVPSQLPADIALPLSLIINELVSNSVLHGLKADAPLTLAISFRMVDELQDGLNNPRYELTLEDDGKGFPEGFSLDKIETFGLTLVTSLVSQLAGEIRFSARPTTRFEIFFTNAS